MMYLSFIGRFPGTSIQRRKIGTTSLSVSFQLRIVRGAAYFLLLLSCFSYTKTKDACQTHEASIAELKLQLIAASQHKTELAQLRDAMQRVNAEKERYKVKNSNPQKRCLDSLLFRLGGCARSCFSVHTYARRWRFCIPSHHDCPGTSACWHERTSAELHVIFLATLFVFVNVMKCKCPCMLCVCVCVCIWLCQCVCSYFYLFLHDVCRDFFTHQIISQS
jgi:hypothetical protein